MSRTVRQGGLGSAASGAAVFRHPWGSLSRPAPANVYFCATCTWFTTFLTTRRQTWPSSDWRRVGSEGRRLPEIHRRAL